MKLRKIVFWLHLAAGVFAGTVVFIMSITGVALTYQKQMTEWADRTYWPQQAPSGGERLRTEQLISKTLEAQPEATPSAITFYSNPEAPAMVAAGPGQNVFVNRYSGEVRAVAPTALRGFFRFATDWHRYLGATGEYRAAGKAITGASNLAFLFIVCSGLYLWWPRTWTLPSVRAVTWFKRGVSGKARDFNWHNVFGFWTAIPLFFVVLSATIISYPWASNLVYQMAGSPPPVRGQQQQQRGGGNNAPNGAASAALDLNGIDALLAQAEQQAPGWRTINLRLPTSTDRQVTFAIDRSFGGQPQFRSTLVLDKATGSIVRHQTFADQTRGERARSWLRFVHTGEFYGVAGQTIAGIASAAGVMLVITGVSLTLRRFRSWIVGRRRARTIIVAQGGAHESDPSQRVWRA
jgi:uncharacterized iron-regulated membrane protein